MTQPLEDKASVYLEPAQKAIATTLIMIATMAVVLDQTIANVALPHMQATLGATPDSISWVLTSYILATAIATPITGWLAGRVGRIRLFGIAIVGFTVSSALCGLSVSLPMMVAARVTQGFFGAFLMPLSQAFIYDMNRPSDQVRALTIWGMGVMVAPVVGPALGGFLTEVLDWRWVFFINVPVGIIAGIGIFAVMPKFPSVSRPFDGVGFIIIVIALCGLQLALDRGTQEDWLESTEIIVELGVSAAAFWMLFFHLRRHPHAIIPAQLFHNRNFVGAMLLALVVVPISIAGAALLPPLVQVLLDYPVMTAGLLMVPRGVAMLVGMLVGARLMQRFDGRLVIALGLVLVIISLWLQTSFSLGMDSRLLIVSGLFQGAGLGCSMTTINFIAVATLPSPLRTDGAAVFSLVRSIGSSLLIALVTALLARNVQINHAEVGSTFNAGNLPGLLATMGGGSYPARLIAAMADAEVNRQAMMIAYIDDFWLMMWLAVAMLPVLLFIQPVRPAKGEAMEVIE
jgi:DHA2 family multidrug resistance protein